MAGWTKADFDANYWIWVHRRNPQIAYPPNFKARIRYKRAWIYPLWARRWDAAIAEFGFLTSESFAVVGAGFAWGCEYLNSIGYTEAVGVEISDYIDGAKDTDERTEVLAELVADNGLAETHPAIVALADVYAPIGAGARTTATIAQEDLLTQGSRNRLRGFFNNQAPDWIVTEDFIQTLTPAELTDWVTEINKVPGSTVIHLVDEPQATLDVLSTDTGHVCFNPDTGERANP